MFANNGAREMKFCLLDGGEDCEHNGVGVGRTSKIFVTQGDILQNMPECY